MKTRLTKPTRGLEHNRSGCDKPNVHANRTTSRFRFRLSKPAGNGRSPCTWSLSPAGILPGAGQLAPGIVLPWMDLAPVDEGEENHPGEAMIGDWANYGMTEREYRTAKEILEKHGFATTKATGRGTIATLVNTRVFDPNIEASDGQSDTRATDDRQAADRQPTGSRRLTRMVRR